MVDRIIMVNVMPKLNQSFPRIFWGGLASKCLRRAPKASGLPSLSAGIVGLPPRNARCHGSWMLCGSIMAAAISCVMVPFQAKAEGPSHPYTFIAAASNNAQTVIARSAVVTGAHCESIAAAGVLYLKFYNGQPTMGTTNAVDEISVPVASSTSGNGHEASSMTPGIYYPNGIYIALTAGQALNDNTSVAAGAANCTVYWR